MTQFPVQISTIVQYYSNSKVSNIIGGIYLQVVKILRNEQGNLSNENVYSSDFTEIWINLNDWVHALNRRFIE